jgi:predicted kinase
MPKLVMFVGLPLTGKTTYRKKHFPEAWWVAASSDDVLNSLGEMNDLDYNTAFKTYDFKHIEGILKNTVEWAVASSLNVVWDQTNLSKKSRAKKLELLPEYEKECFYFRAPSYDALKELSRRNCNQDRAGKTIPMDVLESMLEKLEVPTLDEGFTRITNVDLDGIAVFVESSDKAFYGSRQLSQGRHPCREKITIDRRTDLRLKLKAKAQQDYNDCHWDNQRLGVHLNLVRALADLDGTHITDAIIEESDVCLGCQTSK